MTTQNQLTHSTFVGIVEAIGKIEDGAGNNVFGEVTAAPTANTVLDRLKAIYTQLVSLVAKDYATEVTQKKTRYGRDIIPTWIYGAEATTPAANAALVTKAVSAGKVGHVYGYMITTQEANSFKITWTSGAAAKTFRIHFSSSGTVIFTDTSSIFEGITADAATNVTINNVTLGTGANVYQAAVLYGEV